jgi:hypothetical protein
MIGYWARRWLLVIMIGLIFCMNMSRRLVKVIGEFLKG